MKKFAFLALLCMLGMFAAPVFADVSQISIGRRNINIPIPEGFVDVTRTEPELVRNFQGLAAQTGNRLLGLIVTAEDAQAEAPELRRYFLIQVMTTMENQRITIRDFAEGRRQMRAMVNDEMLEGVEGDINDILSDFDVQVGEMRFVPFDSESENHIAFSIMMNMSAEGADHMMVGSYAMVLANQRMFNVYVYSAYNDVADLIWTQETLNNWVEAIARAN